ncbi:hypothetical protein B5807_03585 [Epicoccum nigrum]|uniref:Uncharacterized protein n=1 Tax=Epicoccum nigrum TaxID=105696 RepID=A0A1Y2M765_EPING|nr:hypothetical protein B5807_03585 [Epicoccum nigrum]
MASFGKVLDLLDDRYLELQDVIGNVEPLPKLVPYEAYSQNALVYRIDETHEIFLGLMQDFTMRRAHELHTEMWSWLVQWEIDDSETTQQPSLAKKLRPDTQNANALSKTQSAPRQAPALTIFERRTLDGALMLEEDMLRILIDIVQIESSLVPNFIEFLYQWIDYYEGDGKALKAALRREIPSLWDFEYHPVLIPQDEESESTDTVELRQTSQTEKTHAKPKPDLAAFELRMSNTAESERLQYREVKFGIQPPRLEQPLPPLINVPLEYHKRIKYYTACFKSRQRALYLLLEAGITTRQINNYQKLQDEHPRETPEAEDGNGLRNYQKDAKFAQDHFEELVRAKQMKHSEIAISNKLAVEAQLAATHAIPDGASGLPLIPPTPMSARRSDFAVTMMEMLDAAIRRNGMKINDVPRPLLDRMNSMVFEHATKSKPDWWHSLTLLKKQHDEDQKSSLADTNTEEDGSYDSGSYDRAGDEDGVAASAPAPTLALPLLPRPLPRLLPLPLPPRQSFINTSSDRDNFNGTSSESAPRIPPTSASDRATPHDMAEYIRNVNAAQPQILASLFSPQIRQELPNGLIQSSQGQVAEPNSLPSPADPSVLREQYFMYLRGRQEALQRGDISNTHTEPTLPSSSSLPFVSQSYTTAAADFYHQPPAQQQVFSAGHPATYAQPYDSNTSQDTINETYMQPSQQAQSIRPPTLDQGQWQFPIPTRSPPDAPTLQSTLTPQAPQFFSNLGLDSGITNQDPLGHPTTSSTNPQTTDTMLPPPLPGITRNAPAPLSLTPPNKTCPFTTLAPEVLITSPFKSPSPSPAINKPIQIYLPKILLPSTNIPASISPDDTLLIGHEPTDAILLGHEDARTGALVLSKAIFLPVGVWENTLKKVRTGNWKVLESYICPRDHPAVDRKGKGKCQEGGGVGCHRAVYDKLEQAHGMMSEQPDVREELLTKRWRVAPGPMTSFDRGAVWEGWGVYVDRGVEMSAGERVGAWRKGESFLDEERLREIEELLREDENMQDG